MFFPSTPLSYAIEITYACNNACSGCANAWGKHRRQHLKDWKDLFDRIAPPDNRHKYAELIRITGGEPTLHKEFRQIVEYADTFGIPHALFSCGRWKHPEEVIQTYQKCQNFIGMLVSLHGSTKSAHNAFVQSSDQAFDETCEKIRCASSSGINVFTNTVLTKLSCEQIEAIIALSHELGADCAVFNRFLGGPHPLDPTEEQLRNAILLIERLRRNGLSCQIGNCVPRCFADNSSEGANGGIEHCAISPKGWVRPNNLTHYVFGNIFEQPIEDIWGSQRAQWYRRQIPEACFECAEISRCRGGEKSETHEQGFEKDRLMRNPIREADTESMSFDPDLKPIPRFSTRKEAFGYLLTRYNWSVPVSYEARPVIDAINGENTLRQIQSQFGDEALNFIGYLYQEGCIILE